MAVTASVTGLNVAQPELAVQFGASHSQVLWFINLYTISLAALLLPLGALGDRWGRKPVLSTGLGIFGVSNVVAGLAQSLLFPFLQVVLGWSALQATLAMMPMALLMMLASVLAPRIATRIGSRSTMTAGVFLGGTGLIMMASFVSVDGGFLSVLPGMLVMGLGMGLSMTPSTEAITSSLPRARQGVASALNDVTREFGTALGVALLGAVLSARYQSSIDSKLVGVPTNIADTAREGVANAVAAAAGAGPQTQAVLRAAKDAFVDGWQHAMWAGAAVMAVLFAYLLVRRAQPGTGAAKNTAEFS